MSYLLDNLICIIFYINYRKLTLFKILLLNTSIVVSVARSSTQYGLSCNKLLRANNISVLININTYEKLLSDSFGRRILNNYVIIFIIEKFII